MAMFVLGAQVAVSYIQEVMASTDLEGEELVFNGEKYVSGE